MSKKYRHARNERAAAPGMVFDSPENMSQAYHPEFFDFGRLLYASVQNADRSDRNLYST